MSAKKGLRTRRHLELAKEIYKPKLKHFSYFHFKKTQNNYISNIQFWFFLPEILYKIKLVLKFILILKNLNPKSAH